ncbi:MAG: class I fructose-bisphosphate aldolase, partial [Fulvimarina manganoxydans]|uniref:class I fructose-bisphosphate aldolase n=1 Tax=Fulvimarina manganoxydans TaxID=937218 RepID=UPI002352202D
LVSGNDQALTGTVEDAMRLGCVGIGFTIYPGAEYSYEMIEELRELSHKAKSCGLISVVWSYPRGGKVTKDGETGLDIIAYAAHMAALLGATIIKVKLPSGHIDLDAAKSTYEKYPIDLNDAAARVKHIMQASFNGKRIVVFSGGAAKNTSELLEEVRAIRDGGGNGSIIGRNSFQRSKEEALKLLSDVMDVYA